MKFVVFREINQRWYWELRLPDGVSVAASPMGYATAEKAFEAVKKIRHQAPIALVFDLVGNLQEGV